MPANQSDDSAPVDCQTLRGSGWFRVVATVSVVGFGIVVGAVRLGPLLAAIMAAIALGATVALVVLLRFSSGRWTALARSGRFCAMATLDPNGRRPTVGVLTIDETGLTWLPTRRSRPGSEVVDIVAPTVESIEYGTRSRLSQDSILIIRLADTPPVGLRVFSRPKDLAVWLPADIPVVRC